MVLHKTLCIQYGERKIDVIIGKATLPGKVFLNKSSSSLISKRCAAWRASTHYSAL
jgi:hypothetical protein